MSQKKNMRGMHVVLHNYKYSVLNIYHGICSLPFIQTPVTENTKVPEGQHFLKGIDDTVMICET